MKRNPSDPRHFDPIALCLAIWLGCITAGVGLVHLSKAVSMHTAMAQDGSGAGDRVAAVPARRSAWLLASGG